MFDNDGVGGGGILNMADSKRLIQLEMKRGCL